MKILFLVAEFPKLSETFILNQLHFLEDVGYELLLFALGNPGEKKIHQEAQKYLSRVVYLPRIFDPRIYFALLFISLTCPKKFLRALKFARREKLPPKDFIKQFYFVYKLRHEKIDLIHAHFGYAGNQAILLKKIFGWPLVVNFYGKDASQIKYGPEAYRLLFKIGDLFIAICKAMREDLNRLGCPLKKIRIVHVGIDTEKFSQKTRIPSQHDNLTVVSVGRLEEKKGHEYLIKAFVKVVEEFPGAKLKIVGGGPLQKELAALVREEHLEGVVELLGARGQNEIPGLVAVADVGALTSVTARDGDREGTPVFLMEAQAMGLPVVSSNHSGIPEVVRDGETGLLVEEKSILGIAEALKKLLRDPELQRKMGQEGRKHIERHFSTDAWKNNLNSIYKNLTKND